MDKSKVISVFAIGMLIVNIILITFMYTHRPHPPKHGLPGEGPKQEIIQRLNFSPQQVEAYQKLIEWHRGEIEKYDRQIMELKNELYQTFDEPGVRVKDSLMNEIAKVQRQIEEIHYKHFQDIKKLCNEEQKAKFNELTHDLARYFHPKGKPRR